MSYNDRLREASVWVAAHPGETITVSVPKADLAEALWGAAADCRWPPALGNWARSMARNTAGMSPACCMATVPADWWEDRADMLASPMTQPTHADCTGDGCTCPCHEEARP